MEQSVANLVDMRDVSFTRGNRCIFDNISLTVPRGKITAIMGPSGIGKTTLLRLIGGQIAPDHVRFFSMVRIFRRCLVRACIQCANG